MSNERRNWCPASGSEDEFVWLLNSDEVRCVECHRYLHLTKRLTLPKHVSHLVIKVLQAEVALLSAPASTSGSDD
jgi:hypothetical protein